MRDQRFLGFFAILWSLFSMAYIAAITFLPVPTPGKDYATTVLGFLLGTIVGGILSWAFDGSYVQTHKDSAAQPVQATTTATTTEVTPP